MYTVLGILLNQSFFSIMTNDTLEVVHTKRSKLLQSNCAQKLDLLKHYENRVYFI